MKYLAQLLCILLIMSFHNVSAQNLRDGADYLLGNIDHGGTVKDKYFNTFCTFESDNSIRDSRNVVLGYLERDGQVKDKERHALGSIKRDGAVQNSYGYSLGVIQRNGRVEDANRNHIGNVRLEDVELERAAVVFFFFKLPR